MTDQGPQSLSVEVTLQDVEAFFAPAINGDVRLDPGYIVNKLAKPRSPDDAFRIQCIKQAGSSLRTLHDAVKFEQVAQNQTGSYDSSLLLGLYKVLDLIVLEGIYPSVQPGTGRVSERRAKSLFYTKHDPAYVPLQGSNQLSLVLNEILGPILEDIDMGLEPLIRHRILSDIITGYANLSHQNGRAAIASSFVVYLEKLPASSLFPAYTSLLQSSTVEWFRSLMSLQLSYLPLRTNGVRSTVDFLAASHRPPQSQPDPQDSTPSSGPVISMEALQQASRLLASVPRGMSPDLYFAKIAPQLLERLDDRAEPALQKTAAYIIGNGILGKRSTGAPGTIGWTWFYLPIFEAISSSSSDVTRTPKVDVLDVPRPAMAQLNLQSALARLSTLIFSHPNPGLVGRLIRPLLLPLWALANTRELKSTDERISDTSFALLSQFLRLAGTTANVIHLADNILCGVVSSYTSDISTQREGDLSSDVDQTADLEDKMTQIDERVQTFCRLLESGKTNDESMICLFTYLFDKQNNKPAPQAELTLAQSLQALALINLLQSVVEHFGNQLAKDPEHMIELLVEVLRYNLDGRSPKSNTGKSSKPSMTTLASIAQPRISTHDSSQASSDLDDSLMLGLSLLHAVLLREDDVNNQPRMLPDLSRIGELLTALLRTAHLDESISLQLKTTLALLRAKFSSDSESGFNTDSDAALDVQRTLALIAIDIASDLPPIRRSALHALQALIKSTDAPLDIPPLALLLLEVMRTDKEEFVYLAAVQTVVELAIRRNLGYVSRLLVDSFQDANEQTGVDGRLRIGEALANLSDELGTSGANVATQGDAVRSMAHLLLVVAGRRGNRQREQLERQRAERLQRLKNKEAERAWGGEVPDFPTEDGSDEYSSLSIAAKAKCVRDLDVIDSIIKGWENTGVEEDVRIRASALSILSRLFETCAAAFQIADKSITTSTTDACLSILTLELEPAHAILRRAAALALFGILKGIDVRLETGQSNSTNEPFMNGEHWLKIEKVLKWVVDTDEDELTVGHCGTVLDGLEAVRMKMVNGVVEAGSRPLDLEQNLRGLTVGSRRKTEKDDPEVVKRIPIIEEVE